MSESKTKSETKKSESKDDGLKVFNFTRDGVVVRAKNRKEAEKLLKEQQASKSKGEDN